MKLLIAQKMKKAGEITEDDLKVSENEIKNCCGYIEDIDKIVAAKIDEIMEV